MKIKPLFYLVVFSSFFISGLLLAMRNNDPVSASIPASNDAVQDEVAIMLPEKQINILAIGVEEVGQTNTKLISTWLILIPPGGEILSFIPIYPANNVDEAHDFSQPHEPILLDASSLQSATQLDLFREQNTWWDEVVLFDEQGLADLYQSVGGSDFIGTAMAGISSAAGGVNSWENPSTAITNQARLIGQMCERGALFSLLNNGQGISSPSRAHFLSSSVEIDIFSLLFSLATTHGEFSCQFPTLE